MNVQVPFGGKKQSGVGREYGEYVSFRPLKEREEKEQTRELHGVITEV